MTPGPASRLKSSIGTVMRSPLRAPGRIHSTVTNRAEVRWSCSSSSGSASSVTGRSEYSGCSWTTRRPSEDSSASLPEMSDTWMVFTAISADSSPRNRLPMADHANRNARDVAMRGARGSSRPAKPGAEPQLTICHRRSIGSTESNNATPLNQGEDHHQESQGRSGEDLRRDAQGSEHRYCCGLCGKASPPGRRPAWTSLIAASAAGGYVVPSRSHAIDLLNACRQRADPESGGG